MRKIKFITIIIFSFLSLFLNAQKIDLRNVETGDVIYKNTYIDQPYMLKLNDGSWLCVFTTGAESESRPGQHIVSMKSTDRGKTWSTPVKIEPNDGPMSSWAIPYLTSYGRIYVFYNYNGDNISMVREKPIKQAGLLGWYCYKYSDDNGLSWSSKNYRIPVRVTAADVFNDFDGFVQMFWGIDKPHLLDGSVYFAFSKIGKFVQDMGEGWMLCSDNLDKERDASKINWKMLPDGEYGIRNPKFQSVQEEHNTVIMNDGSIYCVYRTALGFLGYSISRDKAKTWTLPDTLRYASNIPNVIKNPRACPRLFKCTNGNYLIWYHNHGGKDFKQRTPVWMAGGVEKNGNIEWSQPEILLYTHESNVNGMSYPDLIEADGKYWITETQKHIGRTHSIAPQLLEGLWKQAYAKSLVKSGLVVNKSDISKPTTVSMPKFADLNEGGITVEMTVKLTDWKPNQVLFDSQGNQGEGIRITTAPRNTLRIEVADKERNAYIWTTDEGYFSSGKSQTVAFVVDGLARTISVVIDGKLCDGGYKRQYGWGKYASELKNINGKAKAVVAQECKGTIENMKIYDRYLTTSECISNYNSYNVK